MTPTFDTIIVGAGLAGACAALLAPSEEQTRQILAKASRMLPVLQEATELDATAGARVTVPGLRLPMLGPLHSARTVC